MEQREGNDICVEDFIQEEIEQSGRGQGSEIVKFFEGTTVLITGVTGCIGQSLLEKLLRATNVKKIYGLTRKKDGLLPQDRLQIILTSVLMRQAALKRPNYQSAVTAIAGDLAAEDLELSLEDAESLLREVDVVIHAAATSHSCDSIHEAVLTNIRGTKLLLSFAKKMRRIRCFTMVSSVYVNGNILSPTLEMIYEPPFSPYKILSLADILDSDDLDVFKQRYTKKWPNIQVYTRNLAEQILKEESCGLPVGIVRPSIGKTKEDLYKENPRAFPSFLPSAADVSPSDPITVISSAFEPLVGWIGNAQGPQTAAKVAVSGLLRVLPGKEPVKADLVPVDLTTNAILAFTHELGKTWADGVNKEDLSVLESKTDVPVLHFISGRRNPITWGKFFELCLLYSLTIPTLSAVRVPALRLEPNKFFLQLLQIFYHTIPAAVYDVFAIVTGKQFGYKYLDEYTNVHRFSKQLGAFTSTPWAFQEHNVKILWNKLNAKDQTLFNFDISSVDWNEYMKLYAKGIRTYVFKEEMDTLPEAIRRMKKLKMTLTIVKTTFTILILLVLNYIVVVLALIPPLPQFKNSRILKLISQELSAFEFP